MAVDGCRLDCAHIHGSSFSQLKINEIFCQMNMYINSKYDQQIQTL